MPSNRDSPASNEKGADRLSLYSLSCSALFGFCFSLSCSVLLLVVFAFFVLLDGAG